MKIRWWKKGGKSNNKQKIWPSGTQRNRRERRAEYLGGNMFRGILPPHLHHKVGTISWLPLTPLGFPSESQSPNAQLHVSSATPPAPPLDPGATGDSDPRPRAHPPHRRSFQAWDRILQRETGMDSVPHNPAGPLLASQCCVWRCLRVSCSQPGGRQHPDYSWAEERETRKSPEKGGEGACLLAGGCSFPVVSITHFITTSGNGEGNGTLLQYSCLENPTDGGAW